MKPVQIHRTNLDKHAVSLEEVRECLSPHKTKYCRRIRKHVYQVVSQTAAGRYLEVIYEDRSDVRYVFHAMDARGCQIKLLRRKGKHQ